MSDPQFDSATGELLRQAGEKISKLREELATERARADKAEKDADRLENMVSGSQTFEQCACVFDDSGKVLRECWYHSELRKRADAANARLKRIQSVVETQAEDEALWFVAQTAPEGYLQAQLRVLHASIEGEKK